jgi:hypothetical protein
MSASRREFIGGTAAALSAAAQAAPGQEDGPATSGFMPLPLKGNTSFEDLSRAGLPEPMRDALPQAPRGTHVAWGIPFRIGRPILLSSQPVTERAGDLKAGWFVFLHTAASPPLERDAYGLTRPMRGEGNLGEMIAAYTVVYSDGTEERNEIRRRHHIGTFAAGAKTASRPWPTANRIRWFPCAMLAPCPPRVAQDAGATLKPWPPLPTADRG